MHLKAITLVVVIGLGGFFCVYHITNSSCLKFYAGNAITTFHYEKTFLNEPSSGQIRIRKDKDDNIPVLIIDSDGSGYKSVDGIIKFYQEPRSGPMYTTKTFLGGYEAALAEHTEENYLVSKLYLVPIGNTTISIQYFPENLTPEEGKIAEKMLQSISFKTGSNVKKEAVKACKWLH